MWLNSARYNSNEGGEWHTTNKANTQFRHKYLLVLFRFDQPTFVTNSNVSTIRLCTFGAVYCSLSPEDLFPGHAAGSRNSHIPVRVATQVHRLATSYQDSEHYTLRLSAADKVDAGYVCLTHPALTGSRLYGSHVT